MSNIQSHVIIPKENFHSLPGISTLCYTNLSFFFFFFFSFSTTSLN